MILSQYKNGNCKITLYDDGTRILECKGKPNPNYPSSIDIKITDVCDGRCQHCHERSGPTGQHADLESLKGILEPLLPGVELAMGLNTCDHPGLIPFLQFVKQKGWIANTTINERHIGKNINLIKSLITDDLVKGIGISFTSEKYFPDIEQLLSLTDNIVFHVIMGINSVYDVTKLYEFCRSEGKDCKILVLGYKNYGLGSNYFKAHEGEIEDNKYLWYTRLASYFKLPNMVLSFDNLAIEQLKLRRYFTDEAWDKFFQGKDGLFSMYIDAVKQEYAVSSMSGNRTSFNDIGLIDYFKGFKL